MLWCSWLAIAMAIAVVDLFWLGGVGCGGVGIDGERWGLGRKKMDYLFILLVFYLSFLIILFEKLRLPSCPFEID